MPILERESIDLEQDFHSFFPELQQHIQDWNMNINFSILKFVEHYSGYLKPSHLIRCVTRYDLYTSGEERERIQETQRDIYRRAKTIYLDTGNRL
jgi:hypothetical protein